MRAARRGSRLVPLLAAIVLWVAICALLFCHLCTVGAAESLVYPACALLTAVVAFCFWSMWRAGGTLFSPYGLFLLSATAFNAGQPVLRVLGLAPRELLDGRFDEAITVGTILITSAGLLGWHCGGLLAGVALPRLLRPTSQPQGTRALRSSMAEVGWALYAVACLPFVAGLVRSVPVVLASGYMSMYQDLAPADMSTKGLRQLGALLLPGALLVVGALRGKRPGLLLVPWVLSSMFSFAMGLRFNAVGLVAVLWFWDRYKSAIPRWAIVCVAALLALAMPGLSRVRSLPMAERGGLSGLMTAESGKGGPATSLIWETGGTMQTTAYILQMVPDRAPFNYGVDYLWAVIGAIVPNIGLWDEHPANAHIGSAVLVREVEPEIAAAGGGLGFSFIAEAYAAFGWLGAPLALLVLGFGFARFARWAFAGRDMARAALFTAVLIPILLWPRQEVSVFLRGAVWYGVIPYMIIRALARARGGRRSQTVSPPHLVPRVSAGVSMGHSPDGGLG